MSKEKEESGGMKKGTAQRQMFWKRVAWSEKQQCIDTKVTVTEMKCADVNKVLRK